MNALPCSNRILVVDDDIDIFDAIDNVLTDHDYRAVGAANGVEALEKLQQVDTPPCLILLDLMMPVMDGYAFRDVQCKDERLGRIPVIVVSANTDVERAAREMNAAGYLRKPLQLRALLTTVERFCGKGQATPESPTSPP